MHKLELSGSFLKHTPNPIAPELRTWLNHYSGQSNTFMRSSLMEEAPLMLNYHCDLSPGFNRFRGHTNEMFLYSDTEEYTWVEGGWSDGGDWVDGMVLKQIKMFSRTGEHWMLEVYRDDIKYKNKNVNSILQLFSDPVAHGSKPTNRNGVCARGSFRGGPDSCLQLQHLPEVEERGNDQDREGDVRGFGSGERVRGVADDARGQRGSTPSDHPGAGGKPVRGRQVRRGDHGAPVLPIRLPQVPLPHQDLASQRRPQDRRGLPCRHSTLLASDQDPHPLPGRNMERQRSK